MKNNKLQMEKDSYEYQQFQQELRDDRLKKQAEKKDYNDEMEKCDCGQFLDSHGYCPRCDY